MNGRRYFIFLAQSWHKNHAFREAALPFAELEIDKIATMLVFKEREVEARFIYAKKESLNFIPFVKLLDCCCCYPIPSEE